MLQRWVGQQSQQLKSFYFLTNESEVYQNQIMLLAIQIGFTLSHSQNSLKAQQNVI